MRSLGKKEIRSKAKKRREGKKKRKQVYKKINEHIQYTVEQVLIFQNKVKNK